MTLAEKIDGMLGETPCRCGHPKDEHRATTLRQCTVVGCECEKFRPAHDKEKR